jgi:hypothetical protein
MSEAWIWVHRKDARLKGNTGFITCDKALAEALIAEGKAQDPRVGAHHLKAIDYGNKPDVVRIEPKDKPDDSEIAVITPPIEPTEPTEEVYDTKVMVPKRRGRPPKAEKSE